MPVRHNVLTPAATRCVAIFHAAMSATGAGTGIIPTRLHNKKCVSMIGTADVSLRAYSEPRIGLTSSMGTFSGAEACM